MTEDPLELLRRLTGNPEARFRSGQRKAVDTLLMGGARVLCVQRTGWGKSAVYFVSTAILRARLSGPTLLVSPLLALMRNQIEAAERLGIRAQTINTANKSDWDEVFAELERDEVDILLVSPERFANLDFQREYLPGLLARCTLLVIDEAHCISDWGHDFRPDYRRFARIIEELPDLASVLCTTATANDRVVDDLVEQLGGASELVTIRGPLDRLSLRLEVVELAHQAERLAWLATHIPAMEGSGIVYCSTIRDARAVAEWLQSRGISAMSYAGPDENVLRIEVEQKLLNNEVKVVAATSALAMGYDKPDLAFVVHYQAPGSPIAYYQQVGRAGRAIESAHGVLLKGAEDKGIQDSFIRKAFPAPEEINAVVTLLEGEQNGATSGDLLSEVNIGADRLKTLLKSLEVDGFVARDGRLWHRTDVRFEYDFARVQEIRGARRRELEVMSEFGRNGTCLMRQLRRELDDHDAEDCRRCAVCTEPRFAGPLDEELVEEARLFLRGRPILLEPRKQLPVETADGFRIPTEELLQVGRALSFYGDPGWGHHVSRGKFHDGRFSDELVRACAALLRSWAPVPEPTWIASVPSLRRPELVTSFCERLSVALDINYRSAVRKVRDTPQQKDMANSSKQFLNVRGAFEVDLELVQSGPVLLVDDIVDSRWTMTEIGRALRRAGVDAVHPLALASAATQGV